MSFITPFRVRTAEFNTPDLQNLAASLNLLLHFNQQQLTLFHHN